MTAPIYRYDRHGRKTLMTPPAAKAAPTDAAKAELKARQDAGQLTPQERLLASIFGEIK